MKSGLAGMLPGLVDKLTAGRWHPRQGPDRRDGGTSTSASSWAASASSGPSIAPHGRPTARQGPGDSIDRSCRTLLHRDARLPKNQVDSDKLVGTLLADGMAAADDAADADLVVVNTCAFIEEARQESIDTVLALADAAGGRRAGRHRLHGRALRRASWPRRSPRPTRWPASACRSRSGASPARRVPSFDLLNLPRPPAAAPWAYVKVAEGCDKACGFCAIPSFRGPQRSRSIEQILDEVDDLGGARRSSWSPRTSPATARDQGVGAGSIVPLVEAVAARVPGPAALPVPVRAHAAARRRGPRHRRALLRPVAAARLAAAGAPHAPLGRRRPVPRRIDGIRAQAPDAAFRSNFIVGYPGETEADHDQLLAFVDAAQLDWCGFFAYSREEGTYAADLDGAVPRRSSTSGWPSCGSARTPSPPPDVTNWWAPRSKCSWTHPGSPAATARPPRSTASWSCPTTLSRHASTTVRIIGAEGPDCTPSLPCWWPADERAMSGSRHFPVGAGHAGQPRHDLACSSRRALRHGPAEGPYEARGRRCALGRAVHHRRHRRPPRPSPWDDPQRRLPRPAGRQGAGARRHVRPRRQRHLPLVARSSSSRPGRWR